MIDFEVKGAIFDLDDTLADNLEHTGQGLHELSRLKAVNQFGVEIGHEGLANYPAELNSTAFRRAQHHTLEGGLWVVFSDVGLVTDEDEYNPSHEYYVAIGQIKNNFYEEIFREHGRPIPGAEQFLELLQQQEIPLAMATTASRDHVEMFLEVCNFGRFFRPERIKAREDFTQPKPHPEVFNLAFESLGLPEAVRAQTLAFEDDPRGIRAAKEAGLFVCGITSRFNADELLGQPVAPDLVADSYARFREMLGL